MRFIDATEVAALGPAAAVEAIRGVLLSGFDPATDPPRSAVHLDHGQLLLMPSQLPAVVGVKVAAVSPSNPGRGLPRIQATYLLLDAETSQLLAVIDGTALTTLRTPAVSVAAVLDRLPTHALQVVVIGAGPQAVGHVEALQAVRSTVDVHYLVRDPARTPLAATALGTPGAEELLASADVVVCATSARTPLFHSDRIRSEVTVIAVGSHEPDARELDSALMRRASVVVEDPATALREAGDVVLAIADGAIPPDELLSMRDLVTGAVIADPSRPLVLKTVGMAWQDLVIAEAVLHQNR